MKEHSRSIVITAHAWAHAQIGGAFKLATEFAEFLSQRDWQVHYVCGADQDADALPTEHNGIRLWTYPYPPSHIPAVLRIRHHIRATRQLTQSILRQHPIDCINGHSPLQYRGALQATRSSVASRLYSVHSPFVEELQTNMQHGRRSISSQISLTLAHFIESSNLKHSTDIQCLSQFTTQLLQQRYAGAIRDKITICPGWIDEQRFLTLEQHSAKSQLGAAWQTPLPTFFTLRRIEQRMGIETLLESARLLHDAGTAFRLLIGGDGSLRPQFQQHVIDTGLSECVQFLGRIAETEVPLCYAAADCFVLPTRALECFGIIILEAYAAGTPVIGTRVAAIPELIQHAGEEWLVPPDAPVELAKKMSMVVDGELSMTPQALRKITEAYRSSQTLQRLENLCGE